MAKEKILSRVKVVIDDQYERFVENENISGVSFRYNGTEKVLNLQIPKERKRSNEQPDKMAEGEKTAMYFNRRRCGGYGFQLQVNVPLFKALGEDVLVDEFRQCVRKFLKKVA